MGQSMGGTERREVRKLLQDCPLSHGELAEEIFGCGSCGKVLQQERDAVASTVREMHRDDEVYYTVDRRVGLRSVEPDTDREGHR